MASSRCDPPAGEGTGQAASFVICEQQTRDTGSLGGKAKAAGDDWRRHLYLTQGCEQCSAFQPLFEGPGSIEIIASFDDQQ